jgi:PTH1 family peptidyl-tRNA hydrolase
MNLSGRAVGELCRYFRISADDMVVFHDELDLPLGKIRMKKGGGSAGHNGLRSIDAEFGPDYRRCRIGIGHPGTREAVLAWVLKDFSAEERAILDPILDAMAAEASLLAASKDSTFASKVALRLASPRPSAATGSA